jgi:hypothetical protein
MPALLSIAILALTALPGLAAGICETLSQPAGATSKPIVVDLEATLDGSSYHGYKLFQETVGHLCPQSSKDLPLRPILAFCHEETEGCPHKQKGSKQGWASLAKQIDELRKRQALGGHSPHRLRIRGILIRRPGTKILCDGDICWGSGFGDGSIAAALVPLSMQRSQ